MLRKSLSGPTPTRRIDLRSNMSWYSRSFPIAFRVASVVRNSEDFEPRLRCLERDTLTMIFKQIGSTFSYSNDTFASSPITVVGPLESLPTHGRNWTGMIHTGHEKQHLAE